MESCFVLLEIEENDCFSLKILELPLAKHTFVIIVTKHIIEFSYIFPFVYKTY